MTSSRLASAGLALAAVLFSACASRPPAPATESWAVTGPPRAGAAEAPSPFQRTRVIGFSQVGAEDGGWFVQDGAFEAIAGDDRWELLWYPGGGVEHWADPDYAGWSAPLVSPCPGAAPPDRVVFVIGGSGSRDVDVLAGQIAAAVAVIRLKLPGAREIVLMPVVGGPEGRPCPMGRRKEVRASLAHPVIDAAIRKLVEQDAAGRAVAELPAGEGRGAPARLVAGPSPRLADCRGYRDETGHLKPGAARRVGRFIAEQFARLDAATAGPLVQPAPPEPPAPPAPPEP